MDVQRITLDVPVDLNKAVNEAVERTNLSKAQYMRMALEVMNMISAKPDSVLIVRTGNEERQIIIPGVITGVKS